MAEVAQAHDGSLGNAHAYVDAIARAGADAVKFQTHIASAESSTREPWRVKFSAQDDSRYAYWKRMEFSFEQWLGLKQHAEERKLEFLSSPFSLEAATMLERIGIRAWKVASGELNNPQLLDYVMHTRRPLLLSTGMSTLAEIDTAVRRMRSANTEFAILQCTSAYPCPAEKVGLNLLPYYRQRYDCPVGLSDHSGTVYPGLAAAAFGIEVLEVHVTFSRECFGPDVPASLTTAELAVLVEGVRFIEKMQRHPVDKDQAANELNDVRCAFTKSVVANANLDKGTVLTAKCLTVRKPGCGISADRLPELVGRTLIRAVAAGDMLQDSDLSLPPHS